jgi:UDP-N-acetylmuramate dehydrogenase
MLNTIPGMERFNLQQNKNISPYLTLRTQVTAEWYCEISTREDWLAILKILKENNIKYTILGGGSNVAILDSVMKGLVLRNMYQKKEILNETDEFAEVLISSGYSVTRLAKEMSEAGLEGFEYHMGLPGTLGGGIYMNSKWTRPDSYLGDNLVYAVLIDNIGNEKKVDQSYFDFSYGYSNLQKTKEFFLEGVFHMKKMPKEELMKRAQDSMKYRSETQPKGQFTSGCFFKNISEEEQQKLGVPTKSAGYLIDQTGLKKTEMGDYYVSEKHANFIMNRGQGTPEDLHKLVDLIKHKVNEKYGITLREEVIIL